MMSDLNSMLKGDKSTIASVRLMGLILNGWILSVQPLYISWLIRVNSEAFTYLP